MPTLDAELVSVFFPSQHFSIVQSAAVSADVHDALNSGFASLQSATVLLHVNVAVLSVAATTAIKKEKNII